MLFYYIMLECKKDTTSGEIPNRHQKIARRLTAD